MANIIIKKYEHFNRALGIPIRNKRHYDYEMKSRGFVSFEEGQCMAEKHQEQKKWNPSTECIEVIKAIKDKADKKGNIVLARHPKIVEAMQKKGMSFDNKKLPKNLPNTGGIS